MHQTVEKQRLFFESNSTKDLTFRISQLDLLQNVLKENETLLYEAIYKDFKPI
jgi:aldehyde dehydrogenase (NAD+)